MLRFMTGPIGAVRAEARDRFARLIGEALGDSMTVKSAATYGDLMETVEDRKADFAWLPPAVYVRCAQKDAAHLLLCGVRAKRAHFRGCLFVRDDTRFETLEDIAGTRVGWVDGNSCAGFLFPRLGLVEQGMNPREHFASQRFLGDHLSVVRGVETGIIDVGATFLHLDGENDDAPIVGTGWELEMPRDRMRSLLISGSIPADTLVATKDVDKGLIDRFAETVQSMHDSREGRRTLGGLFGVERFEPVLPSRYAMVERALQSVS